MERKEQKERKNFPCLVAALSADNSMAAAAFHASDLALGTQGCAWQHSLPAMLCWQAALRCMYFIPPTMQQLMFARVYLGYGGRCAHALSNKFAPLFMQGFLL